MTSPILVTGGTGTLGRHVVPRLRKAGRDVRVLSQKSRKGGTTKTLSGNRQLGEDELSASKVHKCQIVLGLFLPAHQQPPRAIEPRMCPLYDPAPSLRASMMNLLALIFLLTGRADVRLVAS